MRRENCLIACFVLMAVSAHKYLICICLPLPIGIACRNVYDDEHFTLQFVTYLFNWRHSTWNPHANPLRLTATLLRPWINDETFEKSAHLPDEIAAKEKRIHCCLSEMEQTALKSHSCKQKCSLRCRFHNTIDVRRRINSTEIEKLNKMHRSQNIRAGMGDARVRGRT